MNRSIKRRACAQPTRDPAQKLPIHRKIVADILDFKNRDKRARDSRRGVTRDSCDFLGRDRVDLMRVSLRRGSIGYGRAGGVFFDEFVSLLSTASAGNSESNTS
ncbi:hypothetical protein NHQ30_001478 [Ciborinia camelliae]|nr:hypothetical protein NHQ30_001478 [Ciborinia camelliae]